MSHFTISYKGQTSDRKALNDWCNWLGLKRAKLLLTLARRDAPLLTTWRQFDFYCSFAGVSGHPVLAVFAYCHAMSVEELCSKLDELAGKE